MKLGAPLILGCIMIASLVVVQAIAIIATVGLVRSEINGCTPTSSRRHTSKGRP